jgi:hypothetical protein
MIAAVEIVQWRVVQMDVFGLVTELLALLDQYKGKNNSSAEHYDYSTL